MFPEIPFYFDLHKRSLWPPGTDSETVTSAEQVPSFILRSWHSTQRAQRGPRLRSAGLLLALQNAKLLSVIHQIMLLM